MGFWDVATNLKDTLLPPEGRENLRAQLEVDKPTTPAGSLSNMANVLGGAVYDTATTPLPRAITDEAGYTHYNGMEIPPQGRPMTLGEQFKAAGDVAGLGLMGRGGIGPPGRYPLQSWGADIKKHPGGDVTGHIANPAWGEAPVPLLRGQIPPNPPSLYLHGRHPDWAPGFRARLQAILDEFAQAAPEGSSLKTFTDRSGRRTRGKASKDTAANTALNKIMELLTGEDTSIRHYRQLEESVGRTVPPGQRAGGFVLEAREGLPSPLPKPGRPETRAGGGRLGGKLKYRLNPRTGRFEYPEED